ncbi:MAG: glycosyltransferase family 4 protein [Isosphaeraceae bacterium]|nr:glycosyltransferase family 4 protein [Isosphaeraceae bacterium]
MTLAYLTSAYARASDTFIRGEVAQLRSLGHTVHTFSIRRPDQRELISEDVRRERAATEDVVAAGPARLAWAALLEAVRAPGRFLSAVWLAQRFATPGLKGRLWAQAYLLEAAYLARRLRARRAEHLHNHIGEGSAAVATLAATLADIPFSLTVHGPNEFDRPTLLALGEKVKQSAFTATVSEYGRSQLFRWCDYRDWPKVQVVRCGVDASLLGRDNAPIPDEPRLVCVGRLSEQKGQLVLLEAVRILADEGLDAELVLIGDGPLRSVLEATIDALGLRNHVTLAGWKGSAAVADEVLRSRAFVLPSFAEGLPVVLMEALALGRPVIATRVAGIPELVEPGVNGWLVPPASASALAGAIREALEAPSEQLERMGKAGATLVAERHDALANARRLADLFAASPSNRIELSSARSLVEARHG